MDATDDQSRTFEEIELSHLLNALSRAPEPTIERPTLHYSEVGELDPRSRHYREWNFYRREVGRLLAEGREGKWVLIKGEEILGFCDTWEDARNFARDRFTAEEVLVKQVSTHEPVYRIGYNRLPTPP